MVNALAHAARPPSDHDGRERAARGHERPPVRPAQDVFRLRLRLAGRVREREHDRPLDVGRHLAQHGLGEGAGGAGHADEHGGMQRLDHGKEIVSRPQAARLGQRLRPGQLAPVVLRRPLALDDEAVRIEHGHRANVAIAHLFGCVRSLRR